MIQRLSAHRVIQDHIQKLVHRIANLVQEGCTCLPTQQSAEIVLREHILTQVQCLAAFVLRDNTLLKDCTGGAKIVWPGHIPLLKGCSSAKHVRRGQHLKTKQRPARYVQQGPTHGQPDNHAHLAQPEHTGLLLDCGSAQYVKRGLNLHLVQLAAGKINLFHYSWAIHIVLRTAHMISSRAR
jgi:hypothetical protein